MSLIHYFISLTLFCISIVRSSSLKNETENEKLKISFLASVSVGQGMGKLYGGAFYRALKDINENEEILPGYDLQTIFADTKSDVLESVKCMTSHYCHNETMAFVGPEGSCAMAATMSAAWNRPMIVYRCHDSRLSKQGHFEDRLRQNFVRTQPSTSKVSKSVISLLNHYDWKIVTLIVGSSAVWNQTAMSFIHLSKDNNINIKQLVNFKEPYASDANMPAILEQTYRNTRIYVFLGDYHAVIDFVRLIYKKPETNKGDYVVITADERPFTTSSDKYFLKTPFEYTLDAEHINAFRSVLVLSPRAPSNPDWDNFINDVRQLNMEKPINLPRPPPGRNITQQVPIYAAYLYDAVMVYAKAVTKLLAEGFSFKNGSAVIEKIQGQTYRSIQGFDVHVDKQGDAEGNYTLLSLHVNSEKDTASLVPVGMYIRKDGGLDIPDFVLQNEIDWALGYPPLDEPKCGFYGEKCHYEFDWRTATICSVVAAVVCVAMVFICRHYLYEQKLARLLWKIEYKDLVLVDSVEEIIAPTRPKRKSQSSWRFLIDGEEPERATLLGNTKQVLNERKSVSNGSYKGTLVSIKTVQRKNIDINRSLKKQLQLRKELNHDNINRFIGACVDPPQLYIVTQYCARGSLQDILHNEDLHLDDMFIASLVADIVKGMIFIHDSEIGIHGNLKSSNCLVDSRWVLQISDFGLNQFIGKETLPKGDNDKYYKSLLWKAPELLRSRNDLGTQKGDVFSFAIILYEIHGRQGPWGKTEYSAKEIVQKVTYGDSDSVFRPDLSKLTCEEFIKQCLVDCWGESAECRPDFKYIRLRLKPLQQGLKPNIFDNMLAIMEKYANNLEALVAERTEQLSDEKKMTENLLYRMLPRPIANKLKRGQIVEPESYGSVTLYFSDIVGFTALSAESTPMEVIDMLNELYTCFDSIIGHFDVYKVETIGDAYMVVSGLPIRNGDNHAGEIASMSLHLLSAIKSFTIKHRPNDTLKLRIGIHTGIPCYYFMWTFLPPMITDSSKETSTNLLDALPKSPVVAGVVGLKMPRFTLFGDTVNTASRMETHGVPLKIHCSSECKGVLDKLGGYVLSERGFVTMKGKGDQFTYFLEEENPALRMARISNKHDGRVVRACRRSDVDNTHIYNNACERQKQNGYVTCLEYRDSEQCAWNIPKFTRDLNSKSLNTNDIIGKRDQFDSALPNDMSSQDDFKQNLENNNTHSPTFICEFMKSSESMPLMKIKSDNMGYVGPEKIDDEFV